ncbi:MAG: hypothetical protein KGS61_06945 [Verrucomicrobia bacterium]|nr:hypothetical protein [Verrucomicrobiota bacterium]
MSKPATTEDARPALAAHVASKGTEVREKYGRPSIGWPELVALLQDRSLVRYPCEIVFDAARLLPGEFAYPAPKGARPEDGFTLFVHPHFARRLDEVPLLVLYQLVRVNYGEFAGPAEAEGFGAAALGMARDDYYRTLCALADETVDEG